MRTLSATMIGFIGLGLMGRPLSLNLKRAGAQLVIYNRSRRVVDELVALGMTAADSPRALDHSALIKVLEKN
ncbi:MAG: NAD(P)-binding domain-containing protein [Acidiferrobacterales bacterium]